jgi:N-acetylglucosaminyldiphosphoundecaprenol N-acetyl-beta-D-mannosaminyltransferase
MESARTYVLGVGISAVNLGSATETTLGWIARREKRYITVTGVHGVIEAQEHPEFKRILNRSGMTVPDGMPLAWLSRWAGRSGVSRVCGCDFTLSVSEALAREGRSAFYYGGAPGVAEQLARNLEERFPGLRTAGTWCPPFRALTEAEADEVAGHINGSGAELVWVGLSTPNQERWMVEFRERLDAPVLVGVGAVFDFLTGRVRRAPPWMQNSGMEWLHRLSQEPGRLGKRYLRNNPLFVYWVACEKLGLRKFDP